MSISEKYMLWKEGRRYPKWYDKYMVELFETELTDKQIAILDMQDKLENKIMVFVLILYFAMGFAMGIVVGALW